MRYTNVPLPRAIPSLVLGALVLLRSADVGAQAPAVSNPRERSQALLEEGDAALERSDVDEAISKYQAAYYSLPRDDRASQLGVMAVRNAMQVYEQRVASEPDPASRRQLLERQRGLLRELLEALAEQSDGASEVGAEVTTELRSMLQALDDSLAEPSQPARSSLKEPAPTPNREHVETTGHGDLGVVTEPRRDWVGLGLVIGGAALLGGGMGVSVGWWTIRKQAALELDGAGTKYAEGTHERDEYLAQETARARPFLIAGSVMAGVGLAVAIEGVVRVALVRRRAKHAVAMHVTPWLGPTNMGIAAQRRF